MKLLSHASASPLENLPDRIRRARRIAQITQAELARSVGVSASAVAQWEQACGTRPGTAHLVAVSRMISISLEWLATGEGTPRKASLTKQDCAVALDVYARDMAEEILLTEFRKLPASARRHLLEFMREMAVVRHTVRKRG